MAGEFLQWDPGAANLESDANYASDAQRLSGATTPSEFAAALANKLFFQLTILAAAISQMIVDKGGSALDDGSSNPVTAVANLAGQLESVLVAFQDLAPYALLASPTFTGTPEAPTPSAGDSSQKIATTAWGKTGFAVSLGANGYIKLPDFLGGLIIEWGTSSAFPTGASTGSVSGSFPLSFPHAVYSMVATADHAGDQAGNQWGWLTVNALSTSGFTITISEQSGSHIVDTVHARWIAIGY